MLNHTAPLLRHFGVPVQTTTQATTAIVDAPGTTFDFSGVMVASREYSMTFATDDLNVDEGDSVLVVEGRNAGNYLVRKVTPVDDGLFSQATLRPNDDQGADS